MAYPPNTQQRSIIEAAPTGDGVITAGAGTGKTSTLRFVAEAMPTARILYLAYNKTVQLQAAASFPSNVIAKTAHSLAYREFGGPNKRRTGQYPSAKYVATFLGIKPFTFPADEGDITIQPFQIAVAVKEAVGRFCTSDALEPSKWHVGGTDVARNIPEEHRERFIAHALGYTQRAWADIADPKGTLPFMPGRGDNCYLKLWSLSDPQLHFDVILYDEAQDANPATAHVVTIQRCRKIMVGDSAQAIYGWNGAVDAMKNFTSDWKLELSKSYRFGQAIADQANRWLELIPDATLRLTGNEALDSKVAPLSEPTAILCRTNAGCIESAMLAQEAGQRVAIAGGTKDIENFVKAANDLMQGKSVTHPELVSFRDWSEVQAAVKSGESADLGMMVRLVDNYGTHAILEVCRNSTKPEDADVTVSTAHKAKGLEWDHVKIHADFQPPKDGGKLSVPEAMLIYVAVTRAKLTLDNSALGWLDQLEAEINGDFDIEAGL